jgi:hypothetical protein
LETRIAYLDLAYSIIVEKTIFVTHSQAERLSDWLEIAGNSNQRRMACISGINFAVSCQDGISSTPTEAKGSDFSSSWNAPNSFDE